MGHDSLEVNNRFRGVVHQTSYISDPMSTIHNSSKVSDEIAMETMVAGEGHHKNCMKGWHIVRKFEKHCSSPPATLTPDSDIAMAPLSFGILLCLSLFGSHLTLIFYSLIYIANV